MSGNERLQARESAIETRHRELDQRQAQLYRDIEQLIADKTRAEDRIAEIERRESKGRRLGIALAIAKQRAGKADRIAPPAGRRAGNRPGRAAQGNFRTSEATKQSWTAAERQLGYRQQEIETALARYERLGVTEEKTAECCRRKRASLPRGDVTWTKPKRS